VLIAESVGSSRAVLISEMVMTNLLMTIATPLVEQLVSCGEARIVWNSCELLLLMVLPVDLTSMEVRVIIKVFLLVSLNVLLGLHLLMVEILQTLDTSLAHILINISTSPNSILASYPTKPSFHITLPNVHCLPRRRSISTESILFT
jgi:hypothetical protein